jgi:hypothetical protein
MTATPSEAIRPGRARGVLLALAAIAVLSACGDYGGGGSGTAGSSSASPPTGSGGSLPDPVQSIPAFENRVLPLLQANCASCHAGAGPGSPAIAHSDTTTAYYATVNNQKVNLGNPIDSRLVQRLAVDLHYCWGVCSDDAEAMRAAIAAWASDVDFSGGAVDPGLIRTDQRQISDGAEVDSNDQRYSTNRIAYWEFKEGAGPTAADTSGVAPAMDLTLSGADVSWLTNYGIDIVDGMAIADETTSRKLFDEIADPVAGSQQYSLEAWIVPANIDQGDNTPRIASYSRNTGSRNFTLGQVFYQYAFRNRTVSASSTTNGTPAMLTYDMDRDAQATLQHVVITYDVNNGRRFYVDGRWTNDVDEAEPQPLWNWDPTHQFMLGNERTSGRQWLGKVQLVAIYRQALTPEQINQNYLAGVGRKVVLRFDMSAWAGPGAYLEFLVSELDSNSYLFCQPVFYATDSNGLRIAGIRIVVNGTIPVNGQAFTNIDSASFGTPTQVSRLCSIIPQQSGSLTDIFEIDLEIVDGFQHDFTDAVTPFPPDNSINPPAPVEGVRDFERLNASMAAITGVSPAVPAVRQQFEALQQQLPVGTDMRTFVSSNQMGITKLALEYCDAMVEDPVLRDDFFGPATPFDFDADIATAFAGANADLIVDPLVAKAMGTGIPNQPDPFVVATELHALITTLNGTCTICDAQRTRDTVKAACTAIVGSAAVTLH